MERHRPPARALVLVVALLVVLAFGPLDAASPDRLERFRELAGSRLSLAQIVESDSATEAYRDVFALIDEEIVESLASGSVFASSEFLQDRLDAFGDAWGGAALRVTRVGRLLVGAFALGQSAEANSIRVYGRLRDEPGLLATLHREGRPAVTPLPPAAGATQFLAAWEGPPSGRRTRPFRVDLVRQLDDSAHVVWSTATVFPEGLDVRAWSIRGADLRVRYEVHYAGWTAGCEGQTEQEDVWRVMPGGAMTRVSRVVHDGWHRDLKAAAARFFDALAAGDTPALVRLVPDRALREGLPSLMPEPACDASEGPARDTVSVAATGSDRRPWTLTFRRAAGWWRLTAAAPVVIR